MREWYDAMQRGPSPVVRVMLWLGVGLLALVFAVTVMAQWFLWLALTSLLFAGWGMILGGLITAAQIWLLFGTAAKKESCELPASE